MKPEIYYDEKEIDLVWLPKHTKLIAEVANELCMSGLNYTCDAVICGQGQPRYTNLEGKKSYYPYVAWTSFDPDPILNHPKIQKIIMPEIKVGDKVIIKLQPSTKYYNLETYQKWVGVVIANQVACDTTWRIIRWPDGNQRGYMASDLTKVEDNMKERVMPTKEQVIEAANKCPQAREALKILFPMDFERKPLLPGLYRNKKGQAYMLSVNGSSWRLTSSSGAVRCSRTSYIYFNADANEDLDELYGHMKEMEKVSDII